MGLSEDCLSVLRTWQLVLSEQADRVSEQVQYEEEGKRKTEGRRQEGHLLSEILHCHFCLILFFGSK